MTPVLSRAQMRAFDQQAIESCRVPSLLLMENAGRGATDILVREMLGGNAKGRRVIVVCGTGNNGGDGLVVARHLLVRGAKAAVFLTGDASKVSHDAQANLDAWRGLGGDTRELPADSALAPLANALADADVIVDALFGTGLDRNIEGWLAYVVRTMNAARPHCFAVDLPSGLDADTGRTLGVAIEADATATFAHPKLGLLTPNGAALAGRVHVVDVGVRQRSSSRNVGAACSSSPKPTSADGWSAARPAPTRPPPVTLSLSEARTERSAPPAGRSRGHARWRRHGHHRYVAGGRAGDPVSCSRGDDGTDRPGEAGR